MRRFLSAVPLALIWVACSDPVSDANADPSFVWANPPGCDSAAPAVSLSAARRSSLPPVPQTGSLTIDDAWYNLSAFVPGGWAGMYLTPVNGRSTPVLMFVDTTHIADALDSLDAHYPWSHPSFARDSVVVRPVRWNWVQLHDWYRYILLVAGLPVGVSYTDIHESNNRLQFGAPTAADRAVLLQRFSQLGVPCWLVASNIQGYAVPL